MSKHLLPKARIQVLFASLLVCSCGKPEEKKPQPSQGGDPAGGAAVMLRGTFNAPDGASLDVAQKFDIEDASVLQRIGENEVTGKMSISREELQTITFLEGGGREIHIGEGGAKITTKMGEAPASELNEPDPLAGKTIVALPQPDGTWKYSVKGEPETVLPEGFVPADLRADALYPEDWSSFGDIWKPSPAAIGALLDPSFQLSSGNIAMRLLSYTKRRGQACAEISADVEAEGTFKSEAGQQDVKLRLQGRLYRSLHLYQDLEADLSGTIEISERVGNADVRIEGPVRFRRDATWSAGGEEAPEGDDQ